MSDTTEGTTPTTETEGQQPTTAGEATEPSEASPVAAEATEAATAQPAEPDTEEAAEAREAEKAPDPVVVAQEPPEAQEAAELTEAPAAVETAPEAVEAPESEPAPATAPTAKSAQSADGADGADGAEAAAPEAVPSGEGPAPEAPATEGEVAAEGEVPSDAVSLKLLEHLESGKPIQGKVFGWNQGGYHVLIDGLLAFCPRSEIDLGNPKAPKKYIEKKYPFRVIEHRAEGNRFIVSRAKILEEEREKRRAVTRERLSEGAVLEGNVTSLTGFGAFVDLGGGIEGMVHISELSHRSVDHPKDLVKKGQKVQVKVLKIEQDGDRISLSMKALEANPWKEFAEKYPRGAAFTGKITGKTEFGVFVEVEPGIEGLVHVSALPPGASLEDGSLQQGQEVNGWVKETEVKRKRISLSLRPVPTSDPWKDAAANYPEGDVFTGTVEEIAPFGIFINLEPGLTGLLPNSEMSLPRGTHPGRVYPPGSEVRVQIGRIEPKRKRITLLPEGSKVEGSQSDFKEYKKKAKESLSGGMPTLAAAFEKLKQGQK